MSQYRLQSLTLHNFKLFNDITIPFESKSLTILGGPNGYGKTSTFDAIEYVLTGTIKRVEKRKEINSNNAYDTDFLTKSPSDGTPASAQAIFCSREDEDTLLIRRELQSASGRENNPKQLSAHTFTTVVHNGETILKDAVIQIANERIGNILGQNVLKYFEQYFYISQEDRLSFLSKSEKDRMEVLHHLFNMENEETQHDKLRNLKNKFNTLKNELEASKKKLTNQILELKQKANFSSENKSELVTYEKFVPFATRTFVWDQEKPNIADDKKLSELQEQVRGIEAFTQQFAHFLNSQKNEWLEEMARDTQSLQQSLFLLNYMPDVQKFYAEAICYSKLKKVTAEAGLDTDTPEYDKIDFFKLSDLLKIPYDHEMISGIHEQIKIYKKNMQSEDKARATLIKLQEQLEQKHSEWISNNYSGLQENECPFCGHPWPSAESLKQNIKKIHDGLSVGAKQTQTALTSELKKLHTIYEDSFQIMLITNLQKHTFLDTTICENLYKTWDAAVQNFEKFRSKCAEYGLDVALYCLPKENPDIWDTNCEDFCVQTLASHKAVLPSGYIEDASKYNFAGIFRDIFNSDPTHVIPISKQVTNNKLTYLEQRYFLARTEKIDQLKKQKDDTERRQEKAGRIHEHLTLLEEITKNELSEYKKKVVAQLQIPFYLYTGRIIQNYPGGLGILISVQGTDKIHFEAFDRRGHDVLYTLSSGQLSALAISLTLTLNQIYAQDTFRCVLIDDPIQTMDEPNVSSFVELLRNDFESYQFILSSHEDDFSDYIRYKYDKYSLSNNSITMRDL